MTYFTLQKHAVLGVSRAYINLYQNGNWSPQYKKKQLATSIHIDGRLKQVVMEEYILFTSYRIPCVTFNEHLKDNTCFCSKYQT